MKRLALLAIMLTGCAPDRPFLQCTVDDHLSFTVSEVRTMRIDGTILRVVRKGYRATVYHNMLPGENCEHVAAINWELAQ